MVAFVNDQFIAEEKAVLGIGDLSIQRGYGIFDFFRTRNFVPLFLNDYLDRFFKSASALRLQPPYNKAALKEIVAELIRRNDLSESGFKMILTGGYSIDGFAPAPSNFIITQQAVQLSSSEDFEKGLRIILHNYLRDLPGTKSINYLMAIYLSEKVQQQRADDVLYYNQGLVLEFPRSNVFIVTKNNTVVTPVDNVLHGITRMKVLELAAKNYPVEQRAVSVDELKDAAEVFLTSTTRRILPVLQVDDITIANGQPGVVTRFLYESFLQMEETVIYDGEAAVK
ncbi:MAG TPA: aminotransferase class IV [Segetibacter sp.]|jgi:D-alanine transaminase/branched-chain amino acid aminotransferase